MRQEERTLTREVTVVSGKVERTNGNTDHIEYAALLETEDMMVFKDFEQKEIEVVEMAPYCDDELRIAYTGENCTRYNKDIVERVVGKHSYSLTLVAEVVYNVYNSWHPFGRDGEELEEVTSKEIWETDEWEAHLDRES
jgi:hypothetical protein